MRPALFLTMAIPALALAQVPDPTRPATQPQVAAPEAGGTAPPLPETGVQTVILRPGGASTAVINGQPFKVGGKFGDKRVVRITESEVVLAGAGGREVIKVTPAIEKISATKAPRSRSPGKGVQ